jgi:prepilin-type N-terminal cleavage/methylation domain-containing protein
MGEGRVRARLVKRMPTVTPNIKTPRAREGEAPAEPLSSITRGCRSVKHLPARAGQAYLPRGTRPGDRAFTLIELLAVLIILTLLLATFIPYGLSLRESSHRTQCAANLANISRALRDYAASNHYFYPRVRFDPTMGNRWTAFTGPDDANPFASDSAVSANDVTASLWLLVREGLAQPEWFVCPSGSGSADGVLDASGVQTVVKKRGNFRSSHHLNYAYATPFSSITDYRLNDTLPARFALLADGPPSEATLREAFERGVRFDSQPKALRAINSPNHDGDGQNVLYADGTVRFESTPFCGVRKALPGETVEPAERRDGDNVFTALAASPLVDTQPPANDPGVAGADIGPSYRYDSVLVPIVDPRPLIASNALVTNDLATRPVTTPTTQPASAR